MKQRLVDPQMGARGSIPTKTDACLECEERDVKRYYLDNKCLKLLNNGDYESAESSVGGWRKIFNWLLWANHHVLFPSLLHVEVV